MMHKTTPHQLKTQLNQELALTYLIVGADPLLQIESLDDIWQAAKQQQFDEKSVFDIDSHTDWPMIFDYCQSLSLFSAKTCLILRFPESGLNAAYSEKLNQLSQLAHDDLLLLLMLPKLTKAQENNPWFKTLSARAVWVNCTTPEHQAFLQWIQERTRYLQLTLDESSRQSLAFYYEGNLLALSQTLAMLKLLYPDGKITLPRLEPVLLDAAQFTVYHWVDALLKGHLERANHILLQLKANDAEPLILLRVLQKELLQLIQLQRGSKQQPLKACFDAMKIWQTKRAPMSQALQRLSSTQFQALLTQLTAIEISLKQDFSTTIWQDLTRLSVLFCVGKTLPLS